jgi:uncharacterized protein YkwD
MKKLLLGLLMLVGFYSNAQEIISTGSKVSMNEAIEFMEHHNLSRAEVGVSKLIWNKEIAKVAQKYADLLASRNCSFVHSKNENYGENLFMGNGKVYTALDASKGWYSEKSDFTYLRINNSNYSHYTQMIWKNTKEVGVGVAICADGSYIYVANYFPSGNYLGEFPY